MLRSPVPNVVNRSTSCSRLRACNPLKTSVPARTLSTCRHPVNPARAAYSASLPTHRRHGRCHPATVARSASEASAPAASESQPSEGERLSTFMTWLVANGVAGIGGQDSKIGLYESGEGERGLASVKEIAAGDVLLRIPLRMALIDFPEDEATNKLMYDGAPWSVRLAAKLLREVEKGVDSPWLPYLLVLPERVPAPLEVLPWDQYSSIEYQPAINALNEYSCQPAINALNEYS
eukprot:gene1034-3895_t